MYGKNVILYNLIHIKYLHFVRDYFNCNIAFYYVYGSQKLVKEMC